LVQLKIPTTAPIVWNGEELNDVVYGCYEVDITNFDVSPLYPKLTTGSQYYDKYDLEDMVKYCNIEYRIVRGYVWKGAATNKHIQYILDLYEKKRTATDPKMRLLYKLMLNSIYGKTIMKTPKTKKKTYLTQEKFDIAIKKYHNRLVEVLPDTLTLTFQKCYDDKPNFAFIGCAILSMSRRIMNNLFTASESVVAYSNTDSLLIPTENVEKLKAHIGDGLGQLKIEQVSDEAIVVCPNVYWLSSEWFRGFRGKNEADITYYTQKLL
jgi:hypothetical protein